MNKAQLIEAVAARLDGDKKNVQLVLDTVIDTIEREVVRGEKVVVTGFLAFEKAVRPARNARNPRTGEAVRLKRTNVPKIRVGSSFKEIVSGARKLPALPKRTSKKTTAAAPARRRATTTAKKTAAKKTTARKTTARKTTARKSTARRGR